MKYVEWKYIDCPYSHDSAWQGEQSDVALFNARDTCKGGTVV